MELKRMSAPIAYAKLMSANIDGAVKLMLGHLSLRNQFDSKICDATDLCECMCEVLI